MFSKFAILALGCTSTQAVKIEQKESSEFPFFVIAHRQPEMDRGNSFQMQAPIHEAVIEMRPMFIRRPSFGIDSMDDIAEMQSRMNHQFEHMQDIENQLARQEQMQRVDEQQASQSEAKVVREYKSDKFATVDSTSHCADGICVIQECTNGVCKSYKKSQQNGQIINEPSSQAKTMTNATKAQNVTKNVSAPADTKKVKSQQKEAIKAKRQINGVKRVTTDSHGNIVPAEAPQDTKKVSVNSTQKANVTQKAQVKKNVTANATTKSNITKNTTVQTNVSSLVNMTANKSTNALVAVNVTSNNTKNVTANVTKNSTANVSTNASANATVGLISEAFGGAVNITSMMDKVTDIKRTGNYSAGSLVQMNKTSNLSIDANSSSTQTINATLNVSKFAGIGSTKGQIELQQQKNQEQVDEEIDNAVYSGEKTKVVADIEKLTNKIKYHGDSLMQKQSKIQEMMMKMSEQI